MKIQRQQPENSTYVKEEESIHTKQTYIHTIIHSYKAKNKQFQQNIAT